MDSTGTSIKKPNNKLYKILRSLSKKEMNLLADFLNSPYFNKKKIIVDFFNYIRKFHPKFNDQELNKKCIHSILFGSEPFKDEKINILIRELTNHCIHFLTLQEIDKSDLDRDKLYLNALGKRNLDELFFKLGNRMKTSLESLMYKGRDYHKDMLLLLHQLFFQPPPSDYPRPNEDIHKIMEYLDTFFVLSKLWYSAELYARKIILNEKADILLLEEVKQMASRITSIPLISLYSSIIKFQEQRDFQLSELKVLFESFKAQQRYISKNEQKNLVRHLINLAYWKMNFSKDYSFTEIIFELFEYGLEKDLFLVNGRILDITFTNIAVIGSILNKFEWVEIFIKSYQKHLKSDIQHNAVLLSRCYLFFHKKLYTEVDALLKDVKFVNKPYAFRARTLKIRSQFEMYLGDPTYYRTLLSSLDAFRRNLYRESDINANRKEAYRKFISILRELLNAHFKGELDAKRIHKIKERIRNNEAIIAIQWLQKKVEELE